MRTQRSKPKQAYEVALASTAAKTLQRKFPGRLTDTVVNFLQKELRFDPDEFGPYGRKLSGKCEKKYAAKQRRFRVIYTIDEGSRTINVLRIDPL